MDSGCSANGTVLHLRGRCPDVYIPDGAPVPVAASRVTHLGIGAHADVLEFMAFEGIACCHGRRDLWFGGVTCTDGCADGSKPGIIEVRREEQRLAAEAGEYAIMLQLGYPSPHIRGDGISDLVSDLGEILEATRPQVVYTHNLADKHDTHVAVAVAVIRAIRNLPPTNRPARLTGCEVWRGLDWLPDEDKVVMDVTGHDELACRLNRIFVSQISPGKSYDEAVRGRRAANATFFDPRNPDTSAQAIFGMDMTPLIENPDLDMGAFAASFTERLRQDVANRLLRHSPQGR